MFYFVYFIIEMEYMTFKHKRGTFSQYSSFLRRTSFKPRERGKKNIWLKVIEQVNELALVTLLFVFPIKHSYVFQSAMMAV